MGNTESTHARLVTDNFSNFLHDQSIRPPASPPIVCVCNYIPERKAEPVKLMLAFENANIYIIHIEVTKLSFSKLGHFDNLVLLVDPNVSIIHRFT